MRQILILFLCLFVLDSLSAIVKTNNQNLLAMKSSAKTQRTQNMDGFFFFFFQ